MGRFLARYRRGDRIPLQRNARTGRILPDRRCLACPVQFMADTGVWPFARCRRRSRASQSTERAFQLETGASAKSGWKRVARECRPDNLVPLKILRTRDPAQTKPFAGGIQLASGKGFTEPYLWNYLNSPQSLPALSFAYWMPLPALVAAAGVLVAPSLGFLGARLGFVLLAACVPPLTALIAYRLTQKPAHARLAGIFAIFSGFYLPYITTTDAFPIYMVLGAQFILVAFSGDVLSERHVWMRFFGLGMLAGLLHMTRADGLLWLVGAGLAVWIIYGARRKLSPGPWQVRYPPELLRAGLMITVGYILVSMPWYLRNIQEWGSLLAELAAQGCSVSVASWASSSAAESEGVPGRR